MANNPFDQTNIGIRERPVSGDLNQLQCQIYMTMREMQRAMLAARIDGVTAASAYRSGFIGDGFQIVPSSPAAMSVVVSPGLGWIYDPADLPADFGGTDIMLLSDLSSYKPLWLSSPATFAVPTFAGGANHRVDIIEIRNPRRLDNPLTRRQLDTATVSFEDHIFLKNLAYSVDGQTGTVTSPADSTAVLSYKVGVPGNPIGPIPTVTPGYTKIAEVTTAGGQTTVTGTSIGDFRPILLPGGVVNASVRFRVLWNAGSPTITIIHVAAPPGIQMPVTTGGGLGRSRAWVSVVGGNILNASVLAMPDNNPGIYSFNTGVTGQPLLAPADSSRTGLLFGSTPPLAIADRQAMVLGLVGALFLNPDGTTSSTNAALEDIIWNVFFNLRY